MNLKKITQEFCNVFGKEVKDHEKIKLINRELDHSKNDLEKFYSMISFAKMITIGGELSISLFSENMLDKAQEGWFKIIEKSQIYYDTSNWKKQWVVFALRNGDAIFFNEEDGSINGSINKREFYKLSKSLDQFLQTLTKSMKLELDKYNSEPYDEDEETIPEFIEDVLCLVDDSCKKTFKDFFFE